jgi:hypothetical protein
VVKWAMRLCSLDDCNRPHYGRGLCKAHYRREQRWGDPHGKYRLKGDALEWVHSVVGNAPNLNCGDADWPYKTNNTGYGYMTFNGRKTQVHRVVLSLVTGVPLSPENCALHACDRPICCNPKCLRWGTHQENTEDRVRRNRGVNGERVNTAKLTAEEVIEIRQLFADGGITQLELARGFGVAESTMGQIIHRKSWKHLP